MIFSLPNLFLAKLFRILNETIEKGRLLFKNAHFLSKIRITLILCLLLDKKDSVVLCHL